MPARPGRARARSVHCGDRSHWPEMDQRGITRPSPLRLSASRGAIAQLPGNGHDQHQRAANSSRGQDQRRGFGTVRSEQRPQQQDRRGQGMSTMRDQCIGASGSIDAGTGRTSLAVDQVANLNSRMASSVNRIEDAAADRGQRDCAAAASDSTAIKTPGCASNRAFVDARPAVELRSDMASRPLQRQER